MGVGDLAKYEKLHLATASSFDGAYAKAQLDAHEKAVALFQDYAQNRTNNDSQGICSKDSLHTRISPRDD
jgi:predicted outer membrane protein